MKKTLILLLLSALTGAFGTACNRKALVDYECHYYYKIENKTDSSVTCVAEISETIILPGKTEIIHYEHGMCPYNNGIPDMVPPYYPVLPYTLSHIKVGDEVLPETIWRRDLWGYDTELNEATYTLTLTDELIESLKQN